MDEDDGAEREGPRFFAAEFDQSIIFLITTAYINHRLKWPDLSRNWQQPISAYTTHHYQSEAYHTNPHDHTPQQEQQLKQHKEQGESPTSSLPLIFKLHSHCQNWNLNLKPRTSSVHLVVTFDTTKLDDRGLKLPFFSWRLHRFYRINCQRLRQATAIEPSCVRCWRGLPQNHWQLATHSLDRLDSRARGWLREREKTWMIIISWMDGWMPRSLRLPPMLLRASCFLDKIQERASERASALLSTSQWHN